MIRRDSSDLFQESGDEQISDSQHCSHFLSQISFIYHRAITKTLPRVPVGITTKNFRSADIQNIHKCIAYMSNLNKNNWSLWYHDVATHIQWVTCPKGKRWQLWCSCYPMLGVALAFIDKKWQWICWYCQSLHEQVNTLALSIPIIVSSVTVSVSCVLCQKLVKLRQWLTWLLSMLAFIHFDNISVFNSTVACSFYNGLL